MNIGIDLTSIDPSYRGGVNTYTIGLLQGLLNISINHKIILFVNPHNKYYFGGFPKKNNTELFVIPNSGVVNRIFHSISARSAYLGNKKFHQIISDNVLHSKARTMDAYSDLIYIPTTVLYPYTYYKPTLLSMHDIQYEHYPQFFSKWELIRLKVRYELSAEKATYLQASSQFIKEDLLSHFKNLSREKIVVIPEGVSTENFSVIVNDDIKSKYDLPSDYIFYPAQLWPHKNHITVLKALNRLTRERGLKIPLVMTGTRYGSYELIFSYIKSQKMDYIYYLGKVPFKDIVALYQQARFFITSALYESSSLPFLESAASGCPIIASDTPSNREMATVLKASLFDALNDKELAALIARIWQDDTLIHEHVEHNRINVEYYSWDNAARRYLNFIESRIEL